MSTRNVSAARRSDPSQSKPAAIKPTGDNASTTAIGSEGPQAEVRAVGPEETSVTTSTINTIEAITAEPACYTQTRHRHDRGVRAVHVRNVPESTWLRARKNSLLSRTSFREYVIELLDSCEPLSNRSGS